MRLRCWLVVAVAPLLLAAQSSVPLELPAPIEFPRFVDSLKVSEAILTALTNRRWAIVADTGESVRAQLRIRSHTLSLRLDYSTRSIAFVFEDSERLGYEVDDGERYIHPNANKWLQQLATEVHLQVQRHFYERDPAAVVPLDPNAPVR